MASCECGVCLEQYNNENKRPRCLTCGHTICNSCLAAALKPTESLICPFCRLPHMTPATCPEDVPINYTVLNLLTDSRGTTSRALALLAEVKNEANEFNTSHLSVLNTYITRLQELQRRVKEARKMQETQATALQTLVRQHERVLGDLTQTNEDLEDALQKGMDEKRIIETAQARINACNSLLQVTAAHEDDEGRIQKLGEWRTQVHQLLQSQVVVAARQLQEVSNVALESALQYNMSEISASIVPSKPIPQHPSTPHQEPQHNNIDNMVQLIREVAQRSEYLGSGVYATRDTNGRHRCSQLNILSNRVYISALQEGKPPPYTHTIQYDSIRGLVDENYPRVFLEVSWAQEMTARICIRITNMTTRARQFLLLCMGEHGPSYLHTRLLEVEARGQPGEKVWFGDYENNDGSGGAALPGLTRGPLESHTVTAGLVAGFCYGDEHHKPAHFAIYTNDCPVVYEECAIGRVDEGLDVIKAISNLSDPTIVTITHCGIIVSI